MSSLRPRSQADFDVAIIGGSIVGATLAALLGRQGLRIVLVDTNAEAVYDPKRDQDTRVLALTRASEQVLQRIGAWDPIALEAMGRFREMLVWDSQGSGRVHFDSADLCEPTLGYIVGSGLLQHGLEAAVRDAQHVQWFRPARMHRFTIGEERVDIYLADDRRFSCRLLVGADGGNSLVRKIADIDSKEHDYRQTALTCAVRTEIAHGDIARQVFLPAGPLAFLPLADPYWCSIVWSTCPDRAQTLMALTDQVFNVELAQACGSVLGPVLACGKRTTFPLSRAHAQRYINPRIALVGDAAHRIHPLAGQGANLGIMDAAALAEVVIEAAAAGRDIGQTYVLRRYERWRKGENLAMMVAMDAFKEGFGRQPKPLRDLRNLALRFTEQVPPLKRLIMRRAMGLIGDLPQVAFFGN